MEDNNRISLESLVVDNPDLERLEQLLGQFNVFEAIGAVRHELRHSDFLGFLLDPQQNHGLGDDFVRLFLQKVLTSAGNQQIPISLVDLDVWDLNEIEVLREWQNIDILLIDNTHKFIVIIENKIGSAEHSNQLQRYREIVGQHYSGWNTVNIFLTPDGDIPSDDSYIPADYKIVCNVVERLTEKRASTIGTDVKTLLVHYSQMLRRHIVSESEIAELCHRIYRKHRLALDLIFEHRPDQQATIRDFIVSLINNEPSVRLDTTSKTLIRFTATEWDVPVLLQGVWTKSRQILLFEIYIKQDEVNMVLYIGPGPEPIRQSLFKMVQTNVGTLRTKSLSLSQKYNSIYRKKLMKVKDYEEVEQGSDLENKIKNAWDEFIENDLPKITDSVRNNQELWQLNIQ